MDDVQIHTPPGPEGDRPDLASFDRLWVDVALGPLLDNRLVIDGVELDAPRIFVEYYADGTRRASDFVPQTRQCRGDNRTGHSPEARPRSHPR
jgi:uncharacterized protein involved in outer membrane biogenesis